MLTETEKKKKVCDHYWEESFCWELFLPAKEIIQTSILGTCDHVSWDSLFS